MEVKTWKLVLYSHTSLPNRKKLSTTGLNNNLRYILITKAAGGQWSEAQRQAMYLRHPEFNN